MVQRSTAQRDRARNAFRRARPACHICGEPIDYTLPYRHPREFVVDHVEPLQLGGPDTTRNLAAAHRCCNAVKGASPIAPVVRRSGSLS